MHNGRDIQVSQKLTLSFAQMTLKKEIFYLEINSFAKN